jgi:hypothetical protein
MIDRVVEVVRTSELVSATFFIPHSLTVFSTMLRDFLGKRGQFQDYSVPCFSKYLQGMHRAFVDFATAGTRVGVRTFSEIVVDERSCSWKEVWHAEFDCKDDASRCYNFSCPLPCRQEDVGSPFRYVPEQLFEILRDFCLYMEADRANTLKRFKVVRETEASLSMFLDRK